MIRDGFDHSESYFIGTEVEHTPAFNKKTLFVIGLQDPNKINQLYLAHECEHIYFGANMSFPDIDVDQWGQWVPWESMIKPILELGYMCTLDVDVNQVEGLLETGFTEYNNFIPMISVKLPYLHQLGYNATIKIDDKDFDATNHGVWCHSLHTLQDRKVFTPWSKYTKDTVIK